ncbi:unnamed protein product [Acanthoscelides obtectus]|uniref:Zinc finger CCCH-type with G patch domain-containing protein n=1 Tax=Acanthoscelides obtectus TaxID=200917 RepID=A0A9P0PET8_ACAOB|nr:unnamed protein product [Acanthoscelides obtectus]CAK1653918.1 Zinc finger CCCH-type with G patch domain-containing protein [Acanthoscelides obtectus]
MTDEHLFQAEMKKEGAIEKAVEDKEYQPFVYEGDIKSIEGKKCRAPHKHQWGDTVYHNAMICSVISNNNEDEIKVRVLFTNPTHQEMLPCPFYYDSDCKFSEEDCRFSHGEIVLFSSLQEYVDPQFDLLEIGSSVLAKQENNLWHRALIKHLFDDKCLVRFESNTHDIEVKLEHVFPLGGSSSGRESSDSECENDRDEITRTDIINKSLMNQPGDKPLGEWEKYTKGIGFKLMQKMGYVVGTGLGKKAEGIINPVTAVILPQGKSLDYCMQLRERAGGDKDLFNAEKRLKRLQQVQEGKQNRFLKKQQKNKNGDVFNFLNENILSKGKGKKKANKREQIKRESQRELNVKGLQIDETIKRIQMDLIKLEESLGRQKDPTSTSYKQLKENIALKRTEIKELESQACRVEREKELRENTRKLTTF